MLIGVTGRHGVGKSRFGSLYPLEFGFEVINKKELLEKICLEEYGISDWRSWYNYEFTRNPEEAVKILVNHLPSDRDVYLDAIHSNLEWELIQKYVPDAHLIALFSQNDLRMKRLKIRDNESEEYFELLDKKREKYWHNSLGQSMCLMSYVEWAFNTDDKPQVILSSFNTFVNNLRMSNNKGQMKVLKNE